MEKPNIVSPKVSMSSKVLHKQTSSPEKVSKDQQNVVGFRIKMSNNAEQNTITLDDPQTIDKQTDRPKSSPKSLMVEGSEIKPRRNKYRYPHMVEEYEAVKNRIFPALNTSNKSSYPVLSILDISNVYIPNTLQKKKLNTIDMVRYSKHFRQGGRDNKYDNDLFRKKLNDKGFAVVPGERASSMNPYAYQYTDKTVSPKKTQRGDTEDEEYGIASMKQFHQRYSLKEKYPKNPNTVEQVLKVRYIENMRKSEALELPKIDHNKNDHYYSKRKFAR